MDLSGLSAITTAAEMKAWLSTNCLSPISPVMTGTDLGTIIQKVIDVADEVPMVFGRTGNITADADDYAAFYPSLTSSYADPTWITSLAWSKTTGNPTTLSGYGITDAYPLSGNPSGFLTGITSGQVTAALGFTPYNSANPVGYITSAIAANTYVPYTGATGAVNLGNNTLQSGNLGIGVLPLSNVGVNMNATLSGGSSGLAFDARPVASSGVTATLYGYRSAPSTSAAAFSLNNVIHYYSFGIALGTGSAATNQYGFFAESNLNSATNNYGFYGNLGSAANNYNLYMGGTAMNFLQGNLGIGTLPITYVALYVNSSSIPASSGQGYGIIQGSTYSSTVTTLAESFTSSPKTAAASLTIANMHHFQANAISLGAGSAVTNQMGFSVQAAMTNAANNYGFYGSIPAGATNFNLYMNGSAMNYLNGNLGIGNTPFNYIGLLIQKSLPGSSGNAYQVAAQATYDNTVTLTAYSYSSSPSTTAASYTLTNLTHFLANGVTIGSGSAVTNQYGFWANSNLTGAANNYGFYGNIASGAGRWNLYMAGTADNYIAGKLGIGTTSLGAKLNLGAASALQASLNIATGVLLTTPVSGAIEYDGTHLYYTTNTPKRQTLAVLDSPVFTGTVSMPHLKGSSGTPTISASTGAGTGATISIQGTDIAGLIHIVTGTSPAANSLIAAINFANSYGANVPYVVIAPYGSTQFAGSAGVCVSATSSGGFLINSGTTALGSAISYYFTYHVIA